MRVAGAVTLVASFMVAAIFSLLPTSVSVLGSSGSCGAPVVGAFQDVERGDFGISETCRSQSRQRVLIAGAVLLVGGVGGLLMLTQGRRPHQERPFYPPYGPPHP